MRAVLLSLAHTPAGHPRRSPADRGALRCADRVLARIATRAVREALAPTPGARPTRVTVTTSHHAARLTVHLTLPFPADLPALAALARTAATTHVETYTGTKVRHVHIVVDAFTPTGGPS
ncbi:hypothetical protein ABT095_06270 [Kitasatospora sp. NPDC002227]|uniref:hypothetical protein n=1 Tax=Kitasatospora sp. NPDC002227 TaxID=3154773 RepID=UPI003333BFC8